MRSPFTGSMSSLSTLVLSLAILAAGVLLGVASNSGALHLRDNGLALGSVALLLLGPVGLLVGEIVAIRSRAWVGAVLLPVAIALGLVVLGPV